MTEQSDAAGVPRRRLLPVVFALAATVLLLDIATKVWVVSAIAPGEVVSVIGDTVTLRIVRNPGAAFSLATGMTWVLTLVAVGVVTAIIVFSSRLRSGWWALGLGLILGGALGNLVDRFLRSPGPLRGHVVDFFSVGWFPVFNVADSGVTCGAVLLVALTLFGIEMDGTRTSGRNREPEESAGDDETSVKRSADDA